MNKIYISANELLLDSFRLAAKIHESGFRPDFIIGVWRGGTPVAIAIHEFFDYVGIETDHISIRASSYTGINEQDDKVQIAGLEYVLETIKAATRLLIVDDVFDTGHSVRAILQELRASAGDDMPETVKIACPWYKPSRNLTDLNPDFYLHETDDWLVFPHELDGLTLDEIDREKGDLAELIRNAIK
jgi:hypoxanthine phosphoribosyltransferase